MSLLLKALRQAESANAAKTAADQLDLEPTPAPGAKTREWVEPPGLLFGSAPAASAPARRWQLPRLSLVPTVAIVALLVAIAYGIYLYRALQPPAGNAAPAGVPGAAPHDVVAPATEPAPAVEVATLPTVTALPPASRNAPPRVPAGRKPPPARGAAPPAPSPVLQGEAPAALLSAAYAAYQAGQLELARERYAAAAARERSADALLGLAAIAVAQGRDDDAARLYREVLQSEPGNAIAQAALLDLLGNTDALAAESRLKLLIEREPSAQLYQTLANLYADQKRWVEAQAAYFEAWRLAPGNADYAYNLAVALDRLHQRDAALTYYEKALGLPGAHRFDRAQAEARIAALKSAH